MSDSKEETKNFSEMHTLRQVENDNDDYRDSEPNAGENTKPSELNSEETSLHKRKTETQRSEPKKPKKRKTSWQPISSIEIHTSSWVRAPTSGGQFNKRKMDPSLRKAYDDLHKAREDRKEAISKLDFAIENLREAQDCFQEAQEENERTAEQMKIAVEAVEQGELNDSNPWNDNYYRLVEFKNQLCSSSYHGTLDTELGIASRTNPELRRLVEWTKAQKTAYRQYQSGKRSTSYPVRICLLEKLGLFVGKWDHNFEKLKEYKKKHGHCNVPTKSSKPHPFKKLGNWVGYQRHEYKRRKDGKKSQLTEERIERLERLGFVWSLVEPKDKKNENITAIPVATETTTMATRYGYENVELAGLEEVDEDEFSSDDEDEDDEDEDEDEEEGYEL